MMPGIPSPGIVLAWLTVPWASARNSRSAHRTKRPKYFCPAADGTSARLSASMASKKSPASHSLLPWIPLHHRPKRFRKRCGQSGVMRCYEFTAGGWAKGIWGRWSVIIRKWQPLMDQVRGVSLSKCLSNLKILNMTKQYVEKTHGWLKISNSKEEHQ